MGKDGVNYRFLCCVTLVLFFSYCSTKVKPAGFIDHPEDMREEPGIPIQKGLALHLAVTEVVPSTPAVEAAGFLVWGVQYFNSCSIAFEAKLQDLSNGEVLATFADRERPPVSVIADLGKFSRYRPLERIVTQWAAQFVAILKLSPGESIEDSGSIKVVNW